MLLKHDISMITVTIFKLQYKFNARICHHLRYTSYKVVREEQGQSLSSETMPGEVLFTFQYIPKQLQRTWEEWGKRACVSLMSIQISFGQHANQQCTHTHTHTKSEILNNIERETNQWKTIIKKTKNKNNTSYVLPLKCHLKWSQNISPF